MMVPTRAASGGAAAVLLSPIGSAEGIAPPRCEIALCGLLGEVVGRSSGKPETRDFEGVRAPGSRSFTRGRGARLDPAPHFAQTTASSGFSARHDGQFK